MIDTSRLRGIIVERGYSQRKVAAELGISETTFYNKMRAGVFNSTEISALIKLLDIRHPMEIFFADVVAADATN